jgi:glycosyltransferase involved in cell wall biosynthesis
MSLGISIAMCTYNGEAYLEAQLKSFVQQTHLPDELVVCDDGSSDSTVQILKAFQARVNFPVRIVINQHNLGSTKNFDQAIGLCNHEIIFLADQDDVWKPEKIERLHGIFVKNLEIKMIFTDALMVDQSLSDLGYTVWQSIDFKPMEPASCRHDSRLQASSLLTNNFVTGATCAFRASLRDRFQPIPENVVHDAWIASISAVDASLMAVQEPLLFYRKHHSQQIGLPKPGPVARFMMLFADQKDPRNGLELILARHQELLKRIVSGQLGIVVTQVQIDLESRIRHFELRLNFRRHSWKYFPVAFRELFNGEYRKQSRGFMSFVRDIIA